MSNLKVYSRKAGGTVVQLWFWPNEETVTGVMEIMPEDGQRHLEYGATLDELEKMAKAVLEVIEEAKTNIGG